MFKLFGIFFIGTFVIIMSHPFDRIDSKKNLSNYQPRIFGRLHQNWCNSQCKNNQTFVPMYVKVKCEKTCRPNVNSVSSNTLITNDKKKEEKEDFEKNKNDKQNNNTTIDNKKENEIITKITNARKFINEAELYSLKAEHAVKTAEKYEMIANLIIESDKLNPGSITDDSFNIIKTLQKDIKKQSELTKIFKKNTDLAINKANTELSYLSRLADDNDLSSTAKATIEDVQNLTVKINEIIEQVDASVKNANASEKNSDQFPTKRAEIKVSSSTPKPDTIIMGS